MLVILLTDDGVSVHLGSDNDGSFLPDPFDIHIHVPKENKINIKLHENSTASENAKELMIPKMTKKPAEIVRFPEAATESPEVAITSEEPMIPKMTTKPAKILRYPEVATESPKIAFTAEEPMIPKMTKKPAEIVEKTANTATSTRKTTSIMTTATTTKTRKCNESIF